MRKNRLHRFLKQTCPPKHIYYELLQWRRRITVILFLFFLLSTINYGLSTSYAEIPHLISYQGKFVDSASKPLHGSYKITFRIYDALSGGTLLWEEIHQTTLDKGLLSIMLGSFNNGNAPYKELKDLSFNQPYYLSMQIEGDPEEMSPRQKIGGAGYAFMSENTLSLPKGIITMWSGPVPSIPAGWALCDGTNGTPDLRNQFIVGAGIGPGSSYSVGATGGATTHRHAAGSYAGPSHTHSVSITSGVQNQVGVYHGGADNQFNGPGHPDHQHTVSGTTSNNDTGLVTGTSDYGSSLPPYYALAYIMKL